VAVVRELYTKTKKRSVGKKKAVSGAENASTSKASSASVELGALPVATNPLFSGPPMSRPHA
jgi:hypothetical protein